MWRALPGPRGRPCGHLVWQQVAGGWGWEQGAPGAAFSRALTRWGVPQLPARGRPVAAPQQHPALPSRLTKATCSGARGSLFGSLPVFPDLQGKRKGKQRNKKSPSVAATDAEGEHQAKGEEGAGGAWQIFPPTEAPSGALERDLCQQTQTACRAGAVALEGVSKTVSQTKAFCLSLHTKPQISLMDSSEKAPCEVLSRETHSSAKVGMASCATGICCGSTQRLASVISLTKSQSIMWTLFH